MEIEEDINELDKKLKVLKDEAQIDTSEKDRLEGLLEIKQNELSEIEKLIDIFIIFIAKLRSLNITIQFKHLFWLLK